MEGRRQDCDEHDQELGHEAEAKDVSEESDVALALPFKRLLDLPIGEEDDAAHDKDPDQVDKVDQA